MQDKQETPQSGTAHADELSHDPSTDQQAAQAEHTDTATKDTTPSIEECLRIAELKAAEHHDAWLRAKAETENVRRRAEEDVAKAARFAAEKFANALLPVRDSLETALATENQTIEKLREGVELTLKQMVAAFESAGIAQEDPLNAKFDPNRHQAISAIEADAEPNTVINVLQKGYMLHERVLRPAMVVVAKAKGD